jgi:hypothetical protein
MSQAKITIVGTLRFSPDESLLYSLSLLAGSPPRMTQTRWLEVLKVDEWPGLGKRPVPHAEKAGESVLDKWLGAMAAYDQALHADPAYRQAASELMERQRSEPQLLSLGDLTLWAYRGKLLVVESTEPDDQQTAILWIKHYCSVKNDRISEFGEEWKRSKTWISWVACLASQLPKAFDFSCGNATAGNVSNAARVSG